MGIIHKDKGKSIFGAIGYAAITNNAANGTASVGTAATNIAHGLGRTPVMVSVIPYGAAGSSSGTCLISAINGTNITVIASMAGTVSWSAM